MARPRAVGYIRVSTSGQVEDGYGLQAQERDVRRCSKTAAFRLVGICRDEGVSGTVEAIERPGLSEALELIRSGHAEVLIIPRLDRLARKLTIQEAALAHVWEHGGRVYACDQASEVLRDDPDDPMRTAMRQMIGVFAQLDRGMTVARLRQGRQLKAEAGGRAGGRSPYGYRASGGSLEPVPGEQETIALALELRRRGVSFRGIARALEEAGHRPKAGGLWHPIQVRRLVLRGA